MEEPVQDINATFIDSLVARFKGIFFDLDNTLVEPIRGKIFRETPKDARWIAGHKAVVQALYDRGLWIAYITNQGLTSFLPTEEAAREFIKGHLWKSWDLAEEIGVYVKAYHCFTFPPVEYQPQPLIAYVKENDPMRKPYPGMILSAMSGFGLTNPKDVLYVGDRKEDAQAAENAGTEYMGSEAFFLQAYKQDKAHTSDMRTD